MQGVLVTLCQASILKSHGYDKNKCCTTPLHVWMKSIATYFRRALPTSTEVLKFFQKLHVLINLIMYHTQSHNTTVLSMSDKQLHWVQLHVSTLDIGHHQVVLRLIEQLYNKQSILGGLGVVGDGTFPHHPNAPSIPCLLYSCSISLRTTR